LTEARQDLSQHVRGRRSRVVDKAWAHRMLLLRAGETLTANAAHWLAELFATDDPTGKLQAVWKVKNHCGSRCAPGPCPTLPR
jgi:transposase